MKIKFSKDISRVHDAMEGLVHCYKDNYKTLYERYDFSVNKAAEEALRFIGERIKLNIPCSDLLFGKETGTAIAFANSRFVPSNLKLDNFIDYLKGLSEEEVKLIVLSDLNPNEAGLRYDELISISQQERRMFDFVKMLDLPSSVKWDTLEFLNNIKANMEKFIELVEKYIPVYKQVIKKNKEHIEKFENYIAKGIESEAEDFFTRVSRGAVTLDAQLVIAGSLFFNSRSLICITVGEILYVYLGMDYEETIRHIIGEDDINYMISIYKNLSDKTRFQILSLLNEKELYGQEIAEKVGITMATVSYHMNFLLASNLVKLEKVGQKGYYSLKKETMKKSATFLNSYFNLK